MTHPDVPDRPETNVGTHAGAALERSLTFNFTVNEWRALVVAAAKGARLLNPERPELRDQVYGLCEQIAKSTGRFDGSGRELRK